MDATESFGKKLLERSNSELYKELETINLEVLRDEDPKIYNEENQRFSYKTDVKLIRNAWTNSSGLKIKNSTSEDQSALFLKSMRITVILGQFLGLNPVMGISQTDATKIRFQFLSWKCMYSISMCVFQLLCTSFCVYTMCNALNISIMSFVSFYANTCVTTILFIRIAKAWPRVIYQISQSQLDEYVDHRVKFRCSVAAIMLIIFSVFEHILSQIAHLTHLLDCTNTANLQDPYKMFSLVNYYWLYNNGVPYSLLLAIFVQIMDTITVITWNYSDLFIICVSLYLISIFDKINEKIEAACNKSYKPWIWRSIREDYTRATRLVRLFDDVISGVIFVSFANNVFFICLQLFNLLQYAVAEQIPKLRAGCPNYPSGPFNGLEDVAYYGFSLLLVACRFLAVSLLASRIHSAAIHPVTVLYGVPTQFYCTEIQRFIEQIHSDEVGLSGLQFFHITKSLVLSVAGTIVTYELVLLQFESNS